LPTKELFVYVYKHINQRDLVKLEVGICLLKFGDLVKLEVGICLLKFINRSLNIT